MGSAVLAVDDVVLPIDGIAGSSVHFRRLRIITPFGNNSQLKKMPLLSEISAKMEHIKKLAFLADTSKKMQVFCLEYKNFKIF